MTAGILCVKIIHPNVTPNFRSVNYEKCYNVRDKRICYLRGSNQNQSWNDARHACDSLNLSLPFFLNEDEVETFKKYLEYLQSSQMANFSVWSAGRRVAHNYWTWINDQIYTYHREFLCELPTCSTDLINNVKLHFKNAVLYSCHFPYYSTEILVSTGWVNKFDILVYHCNTSTTTGSKCMKCGVPLRYYMPNIAIYVSHANSKAKTRHQAKGKLGV